MRLRTEVVAFVPVAASICNLQIAGSPTGWSAIGVVLCVAASMLAISTLVRRVESAVQSCGIDPPVPVADSDAVVRAAARWGADVLAAVARGQPAESAVRDAMPRIAVSMQSDAGSDVSTAASVRSNPPGSPPQRRMPFTVHEALARAEFDDSLRRRAVSPLRLSSPDAAARLSGFAGYQPRLGERSI